MVSAFCATEGGKAGPMAATAGAAAPGCGLAPGAPGCAPKVGEMVLVCPLGFVIVAVLAAGLTMTVL